MKRIFSNYLLLSAFLSVNMLYCADNMQYTILPYDNARDHEETLSLVINHLDEFVPEEKALLHKERLSKNFKKALNTNTHMSAFLTPVENSINRLVLRNKEKLVGFANFYLIQENFDAIKEQDGYIEGMVFENIDIDNRLLLTRTAIAQLQTLGAQRAVIHFVNNKLGTQSAYWPIVQSNCNFRLQEQTTLEKEEGFVRLELNLQK